ncbi:MAG TPA: peptidylprolyl isomerase [Candidatus Dormibacteraeota bacterium]|nr:peptidylprolyl isomerase [Candidatus Dormibacteraeota bacterium]
MKTIASVLLAGMLAGAPHAAAQAPASQAPTQPKSSAAPKSTATAHSGTLAARSSYDRTLLRPALLKEKAPDTYQVKFTTTRGDFVVTVTRAWAPVGADRFYNLVKHHFYDNASFFRAIPEFMVQFGISAYPPVSAAWSKATIKDDAVTKSNTKGFITFATAGPDTRTTQVFINLVDNVRLDASGFAAFGQVTDGMNVVESLYTGYGEGAPSGAGPSQDEIEKQGKAYLDKGFPKLDSIKTATFVGIPAPASKPKPKPTGPAPMKP